MTFQEKLSELVVKAVAAKIASHIVITDLGKTHEKDGNVYRSRVSLELVLVSATKAEDYRMFSAGEAQEKRFEKDSMIVAEWLLGEGLSSDSV